MNKKLAIVFKGEIRTDVFHFDVSMINDDLSYTSPIGYVILNSVKCKACCYLSVRLDEYKKEIVEECTKMVEAIKEVIE